MMTPASNVPTPSDSSTASGAGAKRARKHAGKRKPLWREYAEAIVVAIVLALFIRTFLVQAFKIPSGSMIPSLVVGDHILVNKLSYGIQIPWDCVLVLGLPPVSCRSSHALIDLTTPERHDVVVFRYPEDERKDFIKRIIGLPGDTIQIRDKIVYINGARMDDDAFTQRVDPGVIGDRINPRDNFGPQTVPSDSFFVMGDNRDQSLDSRFWGYVKLHKIKGRAFLIYWSWNRHGEWLEQVRWSRLFNLVR